MRNKAHRGGIRQRQTAPGRRVLGLALSLLMMLASLPMDVTAAVIDRFTAPRVASETAPDGCVFSYLYDDFGRVVRRSSPQGSVLYEYDEITGRRVRTTTASGNVFYGYDLLGRLSEVSVARLGGQDFAEPRVTEYGYDEIGARSYVRRWNGVETEYGYDALDRLVSLEHRSSNGTSIASFAYSYQADGRRSSAVEDTPTGTSIVRYSYDALGRLLSETRTGGAHPFSAGYAYDLNGNRLSRTVAADGVTEATSYSYDANDRLLAETTDGTVTSYAYDGNGSLASKVKAGDFAYAFTYNLQGRLAAMQATRLENGRSVSLSAEYAYNPRGVRTAALQTVDGIVSDRHFLLDEGLTGYDQVLEESAAIGGASVKSYVLALLTDGHGSTRALVGADGSVAEAYDYDAYGRMLGGNPGISEGRSLTDILYSGEQFDPGLQMEYLRARYYDQDSGRFNRIDPFDGEYEEPQSLHKYAYCHCDPINRIDPNGEMSFTSIMTTIAIVSVVSNVALTVYSWDKKSNKC